MLRPRDKCCDYGKLAKILETSIYRQLQNAISHALRLPLASSVHWGWDLQSGQFSIFVWKVLNPCRSFPVGLKWLFCSDSQKSFQFCLLSSSLPAAANYALGFAHPRLSIRPAVCQMINVRSIVELRTLEFRNSTQVSLY